MRNGDDLAGQENWVKWVKCVTWVKYFGTERVLIMNEETRRTNASVSSVKMVITVLKMKSRDMVLFAQKCTEWFVRRPLREWRTTTS